MGDKKIFYKRLDIGNLSIIMLYIYKKVDKVIYKVKVINGKNQAKN